VLYLNTNTWGVMNRELCVWYVWRWVQRDWKKAAINVGICQWWRQRSLSKPQLRRNLLRWVDIPVVDKAWFSDHYCFMWDNLTVCIISIACTNLMCRIPVEQHGSHFTTKVKFTVSSVVHLFMSVLAVYSYGNKIWWNVNAHTPAVLPQCLCAYMFILS